MPEGWVWTTIGAITQPIEKIKPQDDPDKEFIYLDISGIDNDKNVIAESKVYYGVDAPSRARQVVKSGDVLFSTVRTYLKNIAQVPEKYDGQVASTGFAILRGVDDVNNKYLFYYSLADAFLTPLGELQRGTSYPAVRDSDVREQTIPLAPLPEQERIVAEIEKQFTRLDSAVANLHRLQANLDRYKASVLKAACEGRLVPQDPNDEPAGQLLQRILAERRRRWEEQAWQNQVERAQKKAAQARRKAAGRPHNLRDLEPEDWQRIPEPEYADYLPKNDKWKQKYEEPKGVDAAGLPELPDGWVWTKVHFTGSVQLGRQRAPKHHNGPYMRPYLRVANVFEDRIDTSDILEMNFTPEEFETYRLQFGDILLNEGQSLELIGRPAMFRNEVPEACFQNTLVRYRTYPGILNKYSLIVFRSYMHTGRFQKIAKWTTNIAHLGAGRFAELEFPLPPINEQERIVAEVERRLSVVAATQQVIDANLARAGRLRQSILQKAFSGRLVREYPA